MLSPGRAGRRPGRRCPPHPPEQGEPFDGVLADLDRVVLPGITHWQHPSFFAYFPANASGPAILGDLLASGLGVQGMLWATRPAATELETHVLDWLAELLGLPDAFRSDGHRRRRHPGHRLGRDAGRPAGRAAPGQRRRAPSATASPPGGPPSTPRAQTHSSVEKAVPHRRPRHRRRPQGRRRPGDLAVRPGAPARAARARRRRAASPRCWSCASVGTTGTGAIDPVAELGRDRHEHGAWLHVDAAWAGVAAVGPELRWLNDGVERADSLRHQPAQVAAHQLRLRRVLGRRPGGADRRAVDPARVPAQRRHRVRRGRRLPRLAGPARPPVPRAQAVGRCMRWYGAEGLRAHIRGHVALAQEFAALGRGRRAVRARRAAPARAGDVPAARRRRRRRAR